MVKVKFKRHFKIYQTVHLQLLCNKPFQTSWDFDDDKKHAMHYHKLLQAKFAIYLIRMHVNTFTWTCSF